MKCEYCGRRNNDDGHGGCYACGAPVVYEREYEPMRGDYSDITCSIGVVYSPRTDITFKKVTIG